LLVGLLRRIRLRGLLILLFRRRDGCGGLGLVLVLRQFLGRVA
jgi:hypothetical protein